MMLTEEPFVYICVKVWVYRAGFCRFSHARYSNATEDLEDMEKHLTNVAIQVPSGTRW